VPQAIVVVLVARARAHYDAEGAGSWDEVLGYEAFLEQFHGLLGHALLAQDAEALVHVVGVWLDGVGARVGEQVPVLVRGSGGGYFLAGFLDHGERVVRGRCEGEVF